MDEIRAAAEAQADLERVALNSRQLEDFYQQAVQLVAAQCIEIIEASRPDPYALDKAIQQIRERFGL